MTQFRELWKFGENYLYFCGQKWDSSTNWLMNQDFGKSHWFFCDIIRSVNQIQFLFGIQFCWKSIPIVESIFMFVTSFHINKRGFPPLTLISNPGHVLVLTTNFLKKISMCSVFLICCTDMEFVTNGTNHTCVKKITAGVKFPKISAKYYHLFKICQIQVRVFTK